MKVAYADPPYIGCSQLYDCAEVDHVALVHRLVTEFPDGWAMSLHTPALREVLPLCPEDTRIGAWVKPFASFKPNNPVAWAWEPVLFRSTKSVGGTTVRDWTAANIAMRKGLPGAKPILFGHWIFNLLGLSPDDEFVDLFPGTGGMTTAWEEWQRQYLFAPAKGGSR